MVLCRTHFRYAKISDKGRIVNLDVYLLFIDKLLWNLESIKMGSSVGHLDTSCPTMADDLNLIANNKMPLQNTISTVTSYANLEVIN